LHFLIQKEKGWKATLKPNDEHTFKVKIVKLILAKSTDEAIELLSNYYNVSAPHLKVGMPRQVGKKGACYVSGTKTIHVRNRDKLEDPFIILHEFYHHLRTHGGKHRGTERHANAFAQGFVEAFQTSANYSFRVTRGQGE